MKILPLKLSGASWGQPQTIRGVLVAWTGSLIKNLVLEVDAIGFGGALGKRGIARFLRARLGLFKVLHYIS